MGRRLDVLLGRKRWGKNLIEAGSDLTQGVYGRVDGMEFPTDDVIF